MMIRYLFLLVLSLSSLSISAQNGIYLYGNVFDGPGTPVELTAYVNTAPPVQTTFTSTADGTIETFWLPLPNQDWSMITVVYQDCFDSTAVHYVYNDSLQGLIDVYIGINYCGVEPLGGCTDPMALNYNPQATYNDGSCQYATLENDACANAIELEQGTQAIANYGATNTGNIWGECWGFGSGEAEQNSIWYSFTTPSVPASITITAFADGTNTLTDTQFGLFDACGGEMIYCDGNSGEGLFSSFSFSCGELDSNTTYILMIDGWNGDEGSCNLNYLVSTDCAEIAGCTDPTAINYNPNATIDDGSCEYESDCTPLELVFDYTGMPIEGDSLNWEIYNSSNVLEFEGTVSTLTGNFEICLADGCYEIVFSNVPEDFSGVVSIWSANVQYLLSEYDAANLSVGFGINEDGCSTGGEEVYGCTDPTAINYNPNATIDDGSCEYESECTPLELVFDYTGMPIEGDSLNWEIYNSSNVLEFEGTVSTLTGNFEICLADGCYEIVFSNVPEDFSGVVSIWSANVQYLFSEYDAANLSVGFGINENGCSTGGEEVYGCTDPTAINYNPNATIDDGSCQYEQECTEISLIFDYSGEPVNDSFFLSISTAEGLFMDSAVVSTLGGVFNVCLPDGCYVLELMNLPPSWTGVVTAWMGNDVAFAVNLDNLESSYTIPFGINAEGCIDGGDLFGCTDPLAINYNPFALFDDGSCIYDSCSVSFFAFSDSLDGNLVYVIPNFDPNAEIEVLWDFGDGTTSTELFPVHTYADQGPYLLCLTISMINPDGTACAAGYCMEVEGGMEGSGFTSSGFTIMIIENADVLSVNENTLENFELWPNPTEGSFSVSWQQAEAQMRIELLDVSGKTVMTKTYDAGVKTTVIDLPELGAGIYFVKLLSGDDMAVKKLMIKN